MERTLSIESDYRFSLGEAVGYSPLGRGREPRAAPKRAANSNGTASLSVSRSLLARLTRIGDARIALPLDAKSAICPAVRIRAMHASPPQTRGR